MSADLLRQAATILRERTQGVDLHLADWLDLHARNIESGFMIESGKSQAFAVARAILGGGA